MAQKPLLWVEVGAHAVRKRPKCGGVVSTRNSCNAHAQPEAIKNLQQNRPEEALISEISIWPTLHVARALKRLSAAAFHCASNSNHGALFRVAGVTWWFKVRTKSCLCTCLYMHLSPHMYNFSESVQIFSVS
jgi:hypothetical protein